MAGSRRSWFGWIVVALGGFIVFSYGFVVGKWQVFPYDAIRTVFRLFRPVQEEIRPVGLWRGTDSGFGLEEAHRLRVAQLMTLGYFTGSRSAGTVSGVTRYDETRAYEGSWTVC